MAKTKIESSNKKYKEELDNSKINLISWVSFLMGFAQAFFVYIMSTYFKLASGQENIGVFYLVAYSITFFFFLNFHSLVRKFGKVDAFHFSVIGKIAILVALLFVGVSWWGMFLIILHIILNNLEVVSLDMILESYSSDRMSGRIRGKFLTALNVGILLAPFLSTGVLEKFGFHGIFVSLLILNFVVLIFGIYSIGKVKNVFREEDSMRGVIKKTFRRKNIRKVFYISFVLTFFYALTNMYVPIHLFNIGYSWEEIGLILTIMLIPFIFIQYPVGVLADKKTGEKEMIIISLVLMGAATIALYSIGKGSIFIWSLFLLLGRIGAAIVEILRDSYFYKRIDERDIDLINFFKATKPLGFVLAAITSGFLLFFYSIEAVFILTGVVVLTALWPALRLLDNKCEAELKKKPSGGMMVK